MLQELLSKGRPVQALGVKRQRGASEGQALCKRRQVGASRRPVQDVAGVEEELLVAEAMALLSAQAGPSSDATASNDQAEVFSCCCLGAVSLLQLVTFV